MTVRDRKQLKVFVLLLVILGVTYLLSTRINQPSSASSSTSQVTPKEVAASLQAGANDARIRLDLLKQEHEAEEVGRNNLFDYRTGRSGPAGPAGRGGTQALAQPAPPAPIDPSPVTPPVTPPPPPPPPPPMQFKYDGFLKTPKGLVASISDTTGHYSLREGDVLIGRYRIARVTDTMVEVEDLQIPRRQSFARVQQP